MYQLRKALYGLKQAPRAWYNRIYAYLLDNGFDKCEGEPTLYIKENDGKILIVVLYVDDLIFIGSDDFVIVDFKQVMKNEFEMIDIGLLRYFLGIEVKQTENGILPLKQNMWKTFWRGLKCRTINTHQLQLSWD